MHIQRIAEHVLEVRFANQPSEVVTRQIRALKDRLEAHSIEGFQECVPAYLTLTVFFTGSYHQMLDRVMALGRDLDVSALPSARTIEIPVCYAPEYGFDLVEVSRHTGLTPSEVIGLHSSGLYTVQMLGFMPGFPYLTGLDPRLQVPRRSSPRLKVPAGSVGLAGNQTGVYPLDLPGGWQIIGRTAVKLFDLQRDPPVLLSAGDHIQFIPVDQL
ncbi:5-oxoprolinase subunit PxpB [Deinococcus cellulosilyticus]|uniref:Kinase A inhibitor n=1 Tax=Deinococcus cellulosilyticus (strain DSM 18568 / NBRC 106333 / KACC 11606 / 5516J-15) TaxID=1223518 RepID=A0A511N465_DEIC1|nr:5-oxoprolinase subunit PxpB [Deinococcus cellulosilyticus]GEM47660.1 kinase A inhibitor [Deinococcus cellulosilyticus NBRC 106333 = KACC 11606]